MSISGTGNMLITGGSSKIGAPCGNRLTHCVRHLRGIMA